MLGLLGFYDEFEKGNSQPNGSIRDAVQPGGLRDEADLVSYLDTGHVLIDVMEAGRDCLTGDAHRHSPGSASLVTDGAWIWRLDFPHYVETHHVRLPDEFVGRVRRMHYQMPPLDLVDFSPRCDDALSRIGWSSMIPWRPATAVLEPRVRTVMSKAEFERAALVQQRERPVGSWSKVRKPRKG
ncbi:hypothetical protein ACFC63_03975 [Streptomyces albidoflavus]